MTTNAVDLETLRRLAIDQPEATVPRFLALLISTIFLLAVLNLVRRGRLREEYTPIWIVVALGIMGLSVWFDGVRIIAGAIGAWTVSSTLYFFGVIFLLVLSLNYAVRLSGMTTQVKVLAQEISLLRAEVSALSAPIAADERRAPRDDPGPSGSRERP
jgi:hypothetical protein